MLEHPKVPPPPKYATAILIFFNHTYPLSTTHPILNFVHSLYGLDYLSYKSKLLKFHPFGQVRLLQDQNSLMEAARTLHLLSTQNITMSIHNILYIHHAIQNYFNQFNLPSQQIKCYVHMGQMYIIASSAGSVWEAYNKKSLIQTACACT